MLSIAALSFDLGPAITSFMLVVTRVGAMLTATPVFRSTGIPMRVRLVLTLVVSALAMLALPAGFQPPPLGASLLPVMLWELAMGLAMGFCIQLVFAALAVAGESVAVGMGLGFATIVDPQNGNSVPSMSQQFVLLGTLMFVAMNGHLLMLDMLYNSFTLLPPGSQPFVTHPGEAVLNWAMTMYGNALLLALPVIVSMLLTNLAFGIITRAAPQLNIFAVGFPLMLMIGLAVVLINMSSLLAGTSELLQSAFGVIDGLLRDQP